MIATTMPPTIQRPCAAGLTAISTTSAAMP